MRILFISIEYPPETPNGIGSYVVEMAAALARRGHEVHVLSCIPGQPERDYLDGLVHVHRRGEASLPGRAAPRTRARLAHALTCWREMRGLGLEFDVVETPDWMAEGLAVAIGGGPLVAHLHTPLHVTGALGGVNTGLDFRMADRLERATVRGAKLVTAPSRLVTDSLRADDWLGGSGVEISRYPIAPERWRDVPNVGDTAPVALFTGRLERRKAPEVLVDAMASISEQYPEAEAWLGGRSSGSVDGHSYGEWLAFRIGRLGSPCRLLGQLTRDEVKQRLSAARVLVLTSRYDNFPYSGLEGLAAGRPVICTTSTGVSEILEGTGAGAVVEADDSDALAEALALYLGDVDAAVQAGARARELLSRVCSPERLAAERESIYERLLARPASSRIRSWRR